MPSLQSKQEVLLSMFKEKVRNLQLTVKKNFSKKITETNKHLQAPK